MIQEIEKKSNDLVLLFFAMLLLIKLHIIR